MIPLTLYIHLPWCVKKCPYCDFNSHTYRTQLPEADYIQALKHDLLEHLPDLQNRRIHSIFFGGGTPNLFSPAGIAQILNTVQQHCALADALEITLEANPGALEHHDFIGYQQAGINRISLGVQSFQDGNLSRLERIHNAKTALTAIESIKQANFRSFNLDLMHGLPHQTVENALLDLNIAMAQEPDHLSWYQLTLEPNTAFFQNPPALPTEDHIADIQAQGKRILKSNHFKQYEVSAFTKPNAACSHNLNYWQFGDYLGIGAGSHSKLTDLKNKTILRIAKIKQPQFYLNPNKSFIHHRQLVSQATLPFEFMLNALRLRDGVPQSLFEQRTFLPMAIIQPILTSLEAKNLMHAGSKLKLTPLGARFLNDVVGAFLEETHD